MTPPTVAELSDLGGRLANRLGRDPGPRIPRWARTVSTITGTAAVVAAATSVGVGLNASRRMTARDKEMYPPRGSLVDAGGYRLHVLAEGPSDGGPTVIFEGGMGCPLQQWAWIQAAVARHTRTIAYDRGGLGSSDLPPEPRDATTIVRDLRNALESLGETGPFILVGHSFGGLVARYHAQAYPHDVVGLVLADATHPQELERSPRQARGLPWFEQDMRLQLARCYVGLSRFSEPFEPWADLPYEQRLELDALWAQSKTWRTALNEIKAWRRTSAQVPFHETLKGGCTVRVVSAGDTVQNDVAHARMQEEMANLSPDGTHILVREADHHGLIAKPEYAEKVTAAILEIVRAHQEPTPAPKVKAEPKADADGATGADAES